MATPATLSRRLRFEILKRDGFRCRYCGASPLNSLLTVRKLHADHVRPRSAGGANDPDNLVAACVDCNLGKSDVPLDEIRASRFTPDQERERAEQLRSYMDAQREIAGAKRDAEAMVLERWQELIGEWHWTLPRYVHGAIRSVGLAGAIEAVEAVARKGLTGSASVRYFCGCVRHMRNVGSGGEPTPAATGAQPEVGESLLREYFALRTGSCPPGDFGDVVRRAMADRPGGRTLAAGHMFRLIDFCVASTANEYGTPDGAPTMDRLREIVDEAERTGRVTDCVLRGSVFVFSGAALDALLIRDRMNTCAEYWRCRTNSIDCGVAHAELITDTMADLLHDIDTVSVIASIDRFVAGSRALQQHGDIALFRRFMVGWLSSGGDGSLIGPASPLRAWVEFAQERTAEQHG